MQNGTNPPKGVKSYFSAIEIAVIATICHEANRTYCQSIGDDSQPDWETAPEWQQISAIRGVEYHLENPNSKPEDSHNSWLKEKEADGWKYGEVKNVEKKEHPCYVPYNQLPIEQRLKDYIFSSIVKSFIQFKEDCGVFKVYKEPIVSEKSAKVVGLSFNSSGDDKVNQAKLLSAQLIDIVSDKMKTFENVGYWENVLKTQAFNLIISAQMAVVKLLTWR